VGVRLMYQQKPQGVSCERQIHFPSPVVLGTNSSSFGGFRVVETAGGASGGGFWRLGRTRRGNCEVDWPFRGGRCDRALSQMSCGSIGEGCLQELEKGKTTVVGDG
jgi:hypothetical protein